VFAEQESALLLEAFGAGGDLEDAVRRRCEGAPLEVILGWVDFCGRRIAVEAGVFVPRQRTGLLVARAIEACRQGSVVVDLCCGTGAIGVAVSQGVRARGGEVDLHAADLDPVAVRCAARNLAAVDGRVYSGDLYAALPPRLQGRVDVLVANAPYVPTDQIATMPPEARDHEPLLALDGGADGVAVQRRVIAEASVWLAPTGVLLVETGRSQAALTAALMAEHGLHAGIHHDDDTAGTVAVGRTRLAE
jgi:release factor glutamine methyltransferase